MESKFETANKIKEHVSNYLEMVKKPSLGTMYLKLRNDHICDLIGDYVVLYITLEKTRQKSKARFSRSSFYNAFHSTLEFKNSTETELEILIDCLEGKR